MKLVTKIFTAALLICLCFTFCIVASADEADPYSVTEPADQESILEENIPNDIDGVDDVNNEPANPFEELYTAAKEHSSEIFSLLSLIGTILISWFYKKGLLPSVKTVLGSVSSSVTRIKEASDKEIECRKEESAKIEDKLLHFEEALSNQSSLISALESRLISEEDIYRQRERSNLILSSQVDMLYNIFMSSSLPHFQKEAMSEKINSMRKELEGYENE